MKQFYALLTFVTFCSFISQVSSHACLAIPRPRGAQGGSPLFPRVPLYYRAYVDNKLFFPAGNRSDAPGAGLLSQIKAARGRWTPFRPSRPGFRWRAGVCGDLKYGKQRHLKGGPYYFGGKQVHTYRAGTIVWFRVSVVFTHNGFFQFRVCDLKKCGGEISPKCFKNGACRLLRRAYHRGCDSGYSRLCAPIDRDNPSRWYLPCFRPNKRHFQVYGKYQTIRYKMPRNFHCEHCVLHFYYASADRCNPPGVQEYFEGPDAPKNWGYCRGGGNAIGGYSNSTRLCTDKGQFSEEYYNCADIRILPALVKGRRTQRKRKYLRKFKKFFRNF